MTDNIFSYLFFIAFVMMILASAYFLYEKKKIIAYNKQINSKLFNNIVGLTISDGGALSKKIQMLHFDLLVNSNSIFIFPKSLYFIPLRKINLIFSNSDIANTTSREILRELVIKNQNVDLVYYPKHLLGSRIIRLKNLNQDQISIFEDIKQKRNYY